MSSTVPCRNCGGFADGVRIVTGEWLCHACYREAFESDADLYDMDADERYGVALGDMLGNAIYGSGDDEDDQALDQATRDQEDEERHQWKEETGSW